MSKENREMSEKTDRQKAKEIAREYFQKNIDNVSTGTEGFPDASSFIYGFVDGYSLAQKELEEQFKQRLNQLRNNLEHAYGKERASFLLGEY